MTKKIVEKLEKYARTYEEAHLQSKELEQVKKENRKNAGDALEQMSVDKYEVDQVRDKALRVQKIIRKTVKYDDVKLLKLLKVKGKDVFKRAVSLSVNQNVIDELYNEGVLSYDEIQECVDEIAETSSIDIRRVKVDLK